MESKIRHMYDGDLALRAPGSAAITADTTTTKVGIDRIVDSAYGALDGKYGNREIAVVIYLEAGFAAGSDNVYSLKFNTYDANGANPVTHHTAALVAADVGKPLVWIFDTDTLAQMDSDAAQVALLMDVTGTTPSASFWAFVAPC